MRHFKLENSAGQILDITTKEILFHEISGLGFEEENDFRQIGDVWWLNHTNYRQASISGKMIFTENAMQIENDGDLLNLNDPYAKYKYFIDFISRPPLTMMYNPYGPVDDSNAFYRSVRVSKLEKSEKNEYGVIDESIEFSCYTPWYTKLITEIVPEEESEEEISGWIWGGPVGSDLIYIDSTNPNNPIENEIEFPEGYGVADPLVFEPEGTELKIVDSTDPNNPVTTTVTIPGYDGNATPTIFRTETSQQLDKDIISLVKSPVKMTIFGPIVNPTWIHRVRNSSGEYTTIGTGGFTSNVSLSGEDEYIVVDNTGGQYQIYKHNSNGTNTDIYGERDFSATCFITFREGSNQVLVTSGLGEPAKHVRIEGHLYYATV